MALVDRITKFLGRAVTPPDTAQDTAHELARHEPTHSSDAFRAAAERIEIVKACRKMYREDTRARRMISTLARDVVRGGCTIVVPQNPRAEDEAQALLERLDYNARLDDWVRLTMRDGDAFLEAGVTSEMEVATLTRKPTLQMRRNSNLLDEFDDPRRAYWYAPPTWMLPEPPGDAIWFAAWQMIHARWDHDDGERYGSPLFASGTSAYKRVAEGEFDIAVRRKTRAGKKYSHEFPMGTSAPDIEAYIESNKVALDDPFAAIADFFGTAKISSIEGDARLQEIGDVRHHIQTWLIAGILPMELIGYGEDLNRDVLEEKKAQYDRDLDTLTGWVEGQLVKPVLELQWLLKGIYPPSVEYEVKWKAKETLTAGALRDVADAALKLMALGYPREVTDALIDKFLPGIDLQVLLRQSESSPRGEGDGGRASRLADVADVEDAEA